MTNNLLPKNNPAKLDILLIRYF